MDDTSNSTPDWQLLDRFFAGDCSPEERGRILHWVSQDPSRRLLLRDLQALGESPTIGARSIDVPRAWETLLAAVDGRATPSPGDTLSIAQERGERLLLGRFKGYPQPEGVKTQSARLGVFKTRTPWSVTAAVALSVLVLVGTWQAGWNRAGRRLGASASVYTTEPGERATITLPDGSTAALDVASRLEVPADYAAGNHTVRLTGEALFTVTRHDGVAFTVMMGGRAGDAAVRVLGTSFAVRAYPTDTTMTVAVRDGKVVVRTLVLTAAQGVVLSKRGVSRVVPVGTEAFSFATGVLTLANMPLLEAVPELDRWYGADIRLGDPSLARLGVGGKFSGGSLAELTEILQLTFNVRVVRDGRVLTLYPRR